MAYLENDKALDAAALPPARAGLQAEATSSRHAEQPSISADNTLTKPAPLKSRDPADHFEAPTKAGLQNDGFHQYTRDLLFKADAPAVIASAQHFADVVDLGLPQLHVYDSRYNNHNGQPPASIDNNTNAPAPSSDAAPLTDSRHARPEGANSPSNGAGFNYYTIKRGDNLWKIAGELLKERGINADNRDVANYVHQIESYNPMRNPNLIMPGQILKIRDYAPPVRHSAVHRQILPPGHVIPPTPVPGEYGHKQRRSGDGGTPPKAHEQPKPPEPIKPPFATLHEQDGKELKPGGGKLVPALEHEKMKLISLAGKHGDDIQADTNRFEVVVMKRLAENLIKGGMTVEAARKEVAGKIIGTYKQIERVYDADPANQIQAFEFRLAARQIIHNAAHAGNISQGNYSTCAPNSVESMMYKTEPQAAAKLVADVVLTGQYTAYNGKGAITVKTDRTRYGESLKPVLDHTRDYASQLFQVTAVNLAYAVRDPSVHYEQRQPSANHPNHPHGEYLLRNGKDILGQNGKPATTPKMEPRDVAVMYNLISGKPEHALVLESGPHNSLDNGILHAASAKDLKTLLKNRSSEGKLPLVAVVDANKLQFSPSPRPGVAGHVVLIVGYIPGADGQPARVIYDNSWGKYSTRKEMPVTQLYNDLLPT